MLDMLKKGRDRHGIVANTLFDPRRPNDRFQSKELAAADPFWWAEAEPIWITAEKNGILTGTMFWPGEEAPQARGRFRLRADQPGMGELLGIGNGIALEIGLRAHPDHAADIGGETVKIGPVMLRNRPRIRPSSVEEL